MTKLKFKVFTAGTNWEYAVHISRDNGRSIQVEATEMIKWCTNSFGKDAYSAGHAVLYFLTEQQRNWFILRWT